MVSVGGVITIDGSVLLLKLLDILFYLNEVKAVYVYLHASSILQDDILIPLH
jgi:hypothetical protein